MIVDGTLFEFVGHLFLFNFIEAFFYISMAISITLFSSKFLSIKKHFPKTLKVIYVFLVFSGIFHFTFYLTNVYVIISLAHIFGIISFIIQLVLSILLFKKSINAKYYTLAYGLYLCAAIFAQLL
ncbi:MAG: hypothetical protein GY827_11980 [Cytophagales bacterium]|nr:hypothetical protein [Cytophagales bacterium]